MRRFASSAAALVALSAFCACALPASAATKKSPSPVVERSAAGTVIQPTTTILHDNNGHTQVIVVPRRRSYLDSGTEVSVGDRGFRDGDGHVQRHVALHEHLRHGGRARRQRSSKQTKSEQSREPGQSMSSRCRTLYAARSRAGPLSARNGGVFCDAEQATCR